MLSLKRLFKREKFCIICQGYHKEVKQCPSCKRYSGKVCLAEVKDQGVENVCLFCGSEFKKEMVYFESEVPRTIMREVIERRIDLERNPAFIPANIIGTSGTNDIDTFASTARTVQLPESSSPIMAHDVNLTATWDDNLIEYVTRLDLSTDRNMYGYGSRRGSITFAMNKEMLANIGYNLDSDSQYLKIIEGNDVVIEKALVTSYNVHLIEGEMMMVDIDFVEV